MASLWFLQASNPSNFAPVDCTLDKQQQSSENSIEMVNYMLSNPPPQSQISLDKLSFADVMQFAEFGPKLALNQSKVSIDESYFLKFQVLGDRLHDEDDDDGNPFMSVSAAAPSHLPLLPPPPVPASAGAGEDGFGGMVAKEDITGDKKLFRSTSENNNASSSAQQLNFGVGEIEKGAVEANKNRRKRPRAMKTSEEVESQRMTHIAVERNRRRQMNEHLRVLRSLMPRSYVQRGDQASIIGGAIEFVRGLEQLLQFLESQKRRTLFGSAAEAAGLPLPNQHPPFNPAPVLPFPNCSTEQVKLLDMDTSCGGGGGLREEMAENKSCLADIEVRLLGFDAMIKILSRRRPGQLIKTIAALEDLQFTILHTNITTMEQTVLYSFNVKIAIETRCTAEDIANSVQQMLSYIDASPV